MMLKIAAALLFAVSGVPAVAAGPKPLLVYYMPWYTARPFSDNWGWHWTMDHFNPESVNAAGQREIASWYYPLIGPYDSSEPAVLEYHVLLMKLGGIDGVVVDWYGSADFLDYGVNNRATLRLFQFTRKAGLRFCVCYEDQTIRHLLDDNYVPADKALVQAQMDMRFLQTNFFADSTYLRLKGQPVLLNFGPQHFMANSNWQDIFSVLAASNQPAFFTEDNRLPISMGAFDWPPMWMSQAPGTGGVLSGLALENYLGEFERKANAWPAFISSAFPRFHDIYQRAGVRNYWGYLGDRRGDVLRGTLSRAMTNTAAMVQIVTWNDFGEGTMVEPTQEYGFRDLGIIQDLRRQHVEPGFSLKTNELSLALRFYDLRRRCSTNVAASAELDGIFTNLISLNIDSAKARLDRLAK